MMLRIIIFILVIFSFSCNENSQQEDKELFKIGVVIPETGKYAVIGEGERKGLELAFERLQSEYKEYSLKLIFEDFKSESKSVPGAIQKLIGVHNVDAIITSTTAASEIASSIVDKKGIPHFVISPDLDIVSRFKNNFRIYYNFRSEANKIKDFLIKNNCKSIGIIASQYSSIQSLVDSELIPFLKEENIEIAVKEIVPTDERDFRNQFLKIKSSKPDVIFLAPMTNQVELFVNQLREANINPNETKILGSFTFNWKPKTYISSLENYNIIAPVFNPENSDFAVKFVKKYEIEPSFDMAYAYDNLIILFETLKKAKETNTDFKTSFNSLDTINGASGIIKFIGNNDTDASVNIFKVKNKKLVKIE